MSGASRVARHFFALLAALSALASLPPEASAAGFFLPGHGVRPLGRAGAFVASGAGDLNSLWYNPANLVGLGSFALTVDATLVDLNFEFARAPRRDAGGEVIEFPTVANSAPPEVIPQILMGGSLPIEGLYGAAGLYTPLTSGQTFPEGGPQRYTLVDNDASVLFYLHAALAYQVNDSLRVGAGLQNVVSNVVFVGTTSAYTGIYGDPEDEELDALVRTTVRDFLSPSANLGLWTRLAPWLEAAVSLQLPVTVRDERARLEVRLPRDELFANARPVADRIDSGFGFPLMARVGLALRPSSHWDTELAVVYENWSSNDELSAIPQDDLVTGIPAYGTFGNVATLLPLGWRDTVSVRLGGAWRTGPWELRAGYAYETSAVPDEFYSVFLADNAKNVLALGAGWTHGSWRLDASGAAYLMGVRSITDSRIAQVSPADAENETATVVANGNYAQRYLAAGLALTKSF